MNKKGLIGKLIIAVIIVILILLFVKFSRADSFTYYDNFTLMANGSDFALNFSGSVFDFSYNNSVNSSFLLNGSGSFAVSFNPIVQNITVLQNITANLSCAANNTLQVSCSCPSLSCPSVASANCTFPSDSFNSINAKITEGYGTAANDIVFRLQPTKAEIDGYRAIAQNATDAKNQALLEAAKQVEQNIRLGDIINNERKTHDAVIAEMNTERMLLFVADMIMATAIIYLMSDAYGLFDRLRNWAMRRRGW